MERFALENKYKATILITTLQVLQLLRPLGHQRNGQMVAQMPRTLKELQEFINQDQMHECTVEQVK